MSILVDPTDADRHELITGLHLLNAEAQQCKGKTSPRYADLHDTINACLDQLVGR